jgi:hypothetical protein
MLKIRIPEYAPPRNTWRQAIHAAVLKVQRRTAVKYEPDDKLEVFLQLYFTNARSSEIHDVDNRLKDCLDALQGRVGARRLRRAERCQPSSRMIARVIVQKSRAPKQAHGRGHLTIRRHGKTPKPLR